MDIQTPQTAVLKHPIFNSVPIGSAVLYMKGSEVQEVRLIILYVVSPVASISLLIGSDVHHFVFKV